MMEGLLQYLSGYYQLYVEENVEKLMNLMMAQGIVCYKIRREGDRMYFRMNRRNYKRLAFCLNACSCTVHIVNERGLPVIVSRYAKRPGVIAGILLFAVILWFSSHIIWDIRITGNKTVPDSEIEESLRELGCRTGAFIPFLDFYWLCNEFLIGNPDISWISVNMKGNVAYVELRESQKRAELEDKSFPANLVARYSGIIQGCYVYEGRSAVKTGEAVHEGQLLISGVYDSKTRGSRLVHADGEVWAQVTRTVTVEVPMEQERKVYTGRSVSEKNIKIFEKTINLFANGRKINGLYDIIENERRIVLFDAVELPVFLHETRYDEYTMEQWELTEAEAASRAEAEMADLIAKEFAGADILSRQTSAGMDNSGEIPIYRIACEIVCVENIAQERPIYIRQ